MSGAYEIVDDVRRVNDPDASLILLTVAPITGPGLTLVVECECEDGMVTAKRVVEAWDEEGCEESDPPALPVELAQWIGSSREVARETDRLSARGEWS